MKRTLLAVICLWAVSVVFAAEPIVQPNLFRYRLDNGLELYVYRDSSLPLTRVQIAFRAGAIAQTADNAGIFRLYERTLFHGDASHPGAAETAALAELGVSSIGGGTTAERVSYWFTVPSSKTDEGLAFWARMVVAPELDQAAFDTAKQECLAEAAAQAQDPAAIYEAAMTRRLFAKYPWRRDTVGSEATLKPLSLESLRALQQTWFVPGNAALFVGGDVDPEAVRASAEKYFGQWKSAADPWKKALPPNPRPGVMRPTWIVYPDPSMPEGTAMIEARYRGPDLAIDPDSTYAADLWSSLVSPPEGRFKTAMIKHVPGLLGADSITAYYVSQRDAGWISIGAEFAPDPAKGASVDRVRDFKERARGYEITTMKIDPSYFSAEDYDAARARLIQKRAADISTPDGMIDTLAFWWSAASVDYFLGYPDAVAKTGPKEVSAFLETYIMRNLEVVAVRMNPNDFERERRSFENSGFTVIGSGNAFWWQR
jgi:zinc protease